jgi:hypothetical protein
MTDLAAIGRNQRGAKLGDRLTLVLTHNWLPVVLALSGLWLGLATLAPLLMAVGLDGAAQTLVRLGYTDVWNLDGGMMAWEGQGTLSLRRGNHRCLT